VPVDEHGKKINQTQTRDEYLSYINWLSDYLHEKPIEFSDRQKKMVERCNRKEPIHAAIWLSDCCGYYLWDRYILEQLIRKNTKYNDIVQEEFGLWKINQTGDADIDEPFEDVVTTQEEYELIKFDVKLEDKIPSCPGDLDIPYRGVLKTLITRCASQEERRKVIKIFYDNFNETAAK
jgi:hypothetical protein